MPKIRSDPTVDIILGDAKRYRGREVPDLIRNTNIKKTTFYNRLKNPEDISLGELRELFESAGVPDPDILEIVRWKK